MQIPIEREEKVVLKPYLPHLTPILETQHLLPPQLEESPCLGFVSIALGGLPAARADTLAAPIPGK